MAVLYITSDHGGYRMKEELKRDLKARGVAFEDLGCPDEDTVDYPDTIGAAAAKVSENPRANKAIVICGTGIGACITANKFPGVRAALIYNDSVARLSRDHNDSNVACFGGREQAPSEAIRWARVWLETPFSGEERHKRRIAKISAIEGKRK